MSSPVAPKGLTPIKHFCLKHDVMLLEMCLARHPWKHEYGKASVPWQGLSDAFAKHHELEVNSAAIQRRFMSLYKAWKNDTVEHLRKSGVEADYGTREELMDQVFELYEFDQSEAKNQSEAAKAKAAKEDRVGREMAAKALQRLAARRESSHDDDDKSVDDESPESPDTAAAPSDILVANDANMTESSPSAKQSPYSMSDNPSPPRSTSSSETSTPRSSTSQLNSPTSKEAKSTESDLASRKKTSITRQVEIPLPTPKRPKKESPLKDGSRKDSSSNEVMEKIAEMQRAQTNSQIEVEKLRYQAQRDSQEFMKSMLENNQRFMAELISKVIQGKQ